ncbi:MAG: cell division protein ZapA [Muribaculaceae bacterium]|nr:cell division protein ZapA [Muribaculaceae bacterium]
MNSKEIKINIEVKIAEERVAFRIPFSEQDAVRMIESEIRLKIKELMNRYPAKSQKEILAMATYNYASAYYYLAKQREIEIEEADNLLVDAEKLCGKSCQGETDGDDDEFDIY